jgi:single-strand DNA-binding protein
MNIVVLQGTLSRTPEIRSTPNGDVISYEVTTRPDEGPAVTAPVAWFDPPKAAYGLQQGDSVTVVGQVRRRFFRTGGSTQSRTEVVADLVVSSRRKAQLATAFERVFAELEGAAPV